MKNLGHRQNSIEGALDVFSLYKNDPDLVCIEVDIRETFEGELVCSHGPIVGGREISKTFMTQLKQSLPSLCSLEELMKSLFFNHYDLPLALDLKHIYSERGKQRLFELYRLYTTLWTQSRRALRFSPRWPSSLGRYPVVFISFPFFFWPSFGFWPTLKFQRARKEFYKNGIYTVHVPFCLYLSLI